MQFSGRFFTSGGNDALGGASGAASNDFSHFQPALLWSAGLIGDGPI